MGFAVGPAEAKQHSRAFAIYRTEATAKNLTSDDVVELISKYGGEKSKSPSSFDEFTKAVSKAPTHPDAEGSGDCLGFAAKDKSGHLAPMRFERRAVGPKDVAFAITHCGVCHSDLHQIKNDWGGSTFPMVPGHELVGIVTEVGAEVTKVKVGDRAAVGCMVDSCRSCDACQQDLEQFCDNVTWTYNSTGKDGRATQGGYSTHTVTDEKFIVKFPDTLDLAAGAPLLCAGITTYSPLRHWGLDKPGTKLGVVGLGGLGHMAVKFGKAFGAEVTVISTSPAKEKEALEEFGADHFVVSSSEEDMKRHATTLDGIIDTVSAKHDLNQYLSLLKLNGALVMVGLPNMPLPIAAGSLIFKRRTLGGSAIGSIKETQEMIDFCAEKQITCKIELIDINYINEAMERLEKNDVKYRFVIDVAGSLVV
uniref:Enoyl reductase (ER) domain-containing protein n=2 Tax=Auxenochlorella protothecoides TaxID=3075 RepID=A0A1D1ZMZ2_AUXPR